MDIKDPAFQKNCNIFKKNLYVIMLDEQDLLIVRAKSKEEAIKFCNPDAKINKCFKLYDNGPQTIVFNTWAKIDGTLHV